jgi:DNA-binding NtrC family response regulator
MKGLRILVVDDEPGVRDFFVRLLHYQGCLVHAAKNAEEAFAALCNARRYDVVLVDLVLPGTEGLRLIRAMQYMTPGLHFLVVSGKLISPAEQTDLANLGVYFCAKPFRNEELLQAVREVAKREARPEVANAYA